MRNEYALSPIWTFLLIEAVSDDETSGDVFNESVRPIVGFVDYP
jgi:hypothetical protein